VGNLKGNVQLMLMVGLYLLNRLLSMVSRQNPALAPFIRPLLIVYMVFAISTWIIVPISNLFLRLNKFGRYALDRDETVSSTWTGIALLISLVSLATGLVVDHIGFLTLAAVAFLMMIPLGSMLSVSRKQRGVLKLAAALLAVVGLLGVFTAFRTGALMNGASTVFLIGIVVYQFGTNFLASRD
jgi:hypothetical protein